MAFPLEAPRIHRSADDPTNSNTRFRTGTVLHFRPVDNTFAHEVHRTLATTSDGSVAKSTAYIRIATVPAGRRDFFDRQPLDNIPRFYKVRAAREGYEPGPFSTVVRSVPVLLSNQRLDVFQEYQDEGRDRNDTLYNDDGELKTEVGIRDGVERHGLNRNNQTGLAQDGDSVSFPTAYKSPPELTFMLECGRTYLSTASTSDDQFLDIRAQDLTSTGFTLRAKVIAQSSSSSLNVDGWSTAQNTAGPENGDETITTNGSQLFSNLEAATSGASATYQAFFDIDTSGLPSTDAAFVKLYKNSASGSTVFTLVTQRTYYTGTNKEDSLSFNGVMVSSGDLMLELTYDGSPNPLDLAFVTGHGEDNSQPGVQWVQPSTNAIEETVTPNSGDRVRWHAMEAP